MTNEEIIAVIQAHANGEVIESRSNPAGIDQFTENQDPGWNFSAFDYRAKPEARELFVEEYEATGLSSRHSLNRKHLEITSLSTSKIVKFVEVVE